MIGIAPQRNLREKSEGFETPMFVLKLLGTLSLRGDAQPIPVAAQQRRPLGLLSILALGGPNGVSRDRVEAYLWPERGGGAARHSLDQTVYAIRQALGSDVLLSSGGEMRLNPDLVRVDVWEFEGAVRAEEWTAAVEQYSGALLDGVHLADCRELEAWVDAERARLLTVYQGVLGCLVRAAEESGDHERRVAWCRRLANADPLSSSATKQLMLALVAAGDRAGAVQHARVYQQLVRQQLDMEPDVEIETLVASVSRARAAESSAAPPTPALRSDARVETIETEAPRPHLMPLAVPTRRSRMKAGLLAGLALLLFAAATVGSREVRARNSSGAERPQGMTAASPTAQRSYLRAIDAGSDGSKAGLDTAVAYFRKAIQADSRFAEAYAGLADAYVMLGHFGYHPGGEVFPHAKEAAVRSLQLDSTLEAAHPALAYALTWERDFVRADSEFRKAVMLDRPRKAARGASGRALSGEHRWHPVILMLLAQTPEVAAAIPKAAVADPYSLHIPVIELTFTKWIDAYPAMTGFTSDGPGTMKGEILSRIDDGKVTHLTARYELSDPSGAHALKTVVQGTMDDAVGKYELNGVVAWGWMTGAHVRASFTRLSPCKYGTRNVCFAGTIRVQPR